MGEVQNLRRSEDNDDSDGEHRIGADEREREQQIETKFYEHRSLLSTRDIFANPGVGNEGRRLPPTVERLFVLNLERLGRYIREVVPGPPRERTGQAAREGHRVQDILEVLTRERWTDLLECLDHERHADVAALKELVGRVRRGRLLMHFVDVTCDVGITRQRFKGRVVTGPHPHAVTWPLAIFRERTGKERLCAGKSDLGVSGPAL